MIYVYTKPSMPMHRSANCHSHCSKINHRQLFTDYHSLLQMRENISLFVCIRNVAMVR